MIRGDPAGRPKGPPSAGGDRLLGHGSRDPWTRSRDKKVNLIGLVEDGAKLYPKSLDCAELSLPVQKDVWHVLDKASQTLTGVERAALKAPGSGPGQALEKVYGLEKKLTQTFNNKLFKSLPQT